MIDFDWKEKLHGDCIAKVVHQGNVYQVCTAKGTSGMTNSRNYNLLNKSLHIRYKDSLQFCREAPFVAICSEDGDELFVIQIPRPVGTVGRIQMSDRVMRALDIWDYGVTKWLQEQGINE